MKKPTLQPLVDLQNINKSASPKTFHLGREETFDQESNKKNNVLSHPTESKTSL